MKFNLIPSQIHTHTITKKQHKCSNNKRRLRPESCLLSLIVQTIHIDKNICAGGSRGYLNGTTQGSFFLPAPIKGQEEIVNVSGQPRIACIINALGSMSTQMKKKNLWMCLELFSLDTYWDTI